MRIFLIGFMGVGKTTVGKKVAAALHIPFLDLDNYISQQQNMSVADIFQHFGEDYFRMCESKCLQEIIVAHKNVVLACGGGTPAYLSNMQLMNENGTTIYMCAGFDFLMSRIKQSPIIRPMVKKHMGIGNENGLLTLFEQRKPVYERALRVVNVEKLPSNEVVEQILEIL